MPEDLAVCGFDNIPVTRVITPSLTTIDQNPYELGRRTALAIINQIEGQKNHDDMFSVLSNLVLRDIT